MESREICNYTIYKATAPSGKSYIGYTKYSLQIRRKGHEKHTKKLSSLQYAIRKYGKQNIIWEIIEDNIKNRKIAQEREILYIKKFDTYENVFNLRKRQKPKRKIKVYIKSNMEFIGEFSSIKECYK